MKQHLQYIINQLRSEGKDYTHFKSLLEAIKASGLDISKDEILDFVANDYRIQLHTTPNSIAKLISLLAKENQPQSAIDICCGTGNILYYLQNEIDDLTGVEIVENVAELTNYFIPDLHIITADSFTFIWSSGLSSLGSFMFMAVDWLMVVVNTKNVSKRNPRSTMGVRSTRVESFFPFLTPGPFL